MKRSGKSLPYTSLKLPGNSSPGFIQTVDSGSNALNFDLSSILFSNVFVSFLFNKFHDRTKFTFSEILTECKYH